LTGTDEHGLKTLRVAEELGKKSSRIADEISKKFKDLTKGFNISNNDFIEQLMKKIIARSL